MGFGKFESYQELLDYLEEEEVENVVLITPFMQELGFKKGALLSYIFVESLRQKNEIDGKYWIKKTYQEIADGTFLGSSKTISRLIESLEKEGFIITDNHNKHPYDRTKWYSVNMDKIKTITNL